MLLYEVYLNDVHSFNVVCPANELVDMLKKMAFLGQTVKIRNRFYNIYLVWTGEYLI